MTSSAPLPIESLLQHSGWMERLARRLVLDEGAAADIVQETWLATLREPPRRAESVRGWLSKVLRSKAADAHRSRRELVSHEQVQSVPGRVPSVAQSVADAETHRRVTELLLRLDPHYRDVLILRFFDGLPPREIAARLECPVETVRTRTRRALDRLRSELDAHHGGDRGAWLAALFPLARIDRGSAATAGGSAAITGVAVMAANSKIVIAAGIALVLGFGGGRMAGDASGESARADEQAMSVLSQERDAERARAEALAVDVTERDVRVRNHERSLAEARRRIGELEDEVARLSAETAPAPADGLPGSAGRGISFAAYDAVLDDIDWEEVGLRTRELVEILVELRTAVDTGTQMPPARLSDLQNKNAPLIAAAARVAGHLPGAGMNGPYASPPFMSNLITATLRAGGMPLTGQQLADLNRLATEQVERDAAREARYDATTIELRKLSDEIASRGEFLAQATSLLTREQHALLRPESVRDVSNLDLFSPAIQWGQTVRPISHDGTRASVAQAITKDLQRIFQPRAEVRDEVERMVGAWAEDLPDDVIECDRDALAALMMYDGAQVARSAEHALALYETILRDVPLTPDEQARLRAMSAPPVLLRR